MNRLKYVLLVMAITFGYLMVSGDDYETAVNENAHWCQMIKEGTWYASRDEIARRCP